VPLRASILTAGPGGPGGPSLPFSPGAPWREENKVILWGGCCTAWAPFLLEGPGSLYSQWGQEDLSLQGSLASRGDRPSLGGRRDQGPPATTVINHWGSADSIETQLLLLGSSRDEAPWNIISFLNHPSLGERQASRLATRVNSAGCWSLPWSLLFQWGQEDLVHPGDLEGLDVPAHPSAQSHQLDPEETEFRENAVGISRSNNEGRGAGYLFVPLGCSRIEDAPSLSRLMRCHWESLQRCLLWHPKGPWFGSGQHCTWQTRGMGNLWNKSFHINEILLLQLLQLGYFFKLKTSYALHNHADSSLYGA